MGGDNFAVEVDHVFVSASIGAPEARQLVDLGLIEGSPNRHPGQGTANRRFFFANAMLELIWVENEAEARRMDSAPQEHRQPFEHALPIRELSSVRIFSPGAAAPSAAMLAALRSNAFTFEPAARPLLELGFDGERQGQRADLRPALPLVLLW